jgi:hypothetical protein
MQSKFIIWEYSIKMLSIHEVIKITYTPIVTVYVVSHACITNLFKQDNFLQ